ncbi:hypothetical protein CC80DRAFT_370653, partial [Byssothecium circinans]
CTNIIKFTPDGRKYHDFNASRSEPNQRLAEVFGIDNAFTSVDKTLRTQFIRTTVSKIRAATNIQERDGTSKGDWRYLRQSAIDSCNEFLSCSSHQMNLAELVQFVTLKVSLTYLFNDATEAMKRKDCFEHIKYIGRRINELWIESKNQVSQRSRWLDEKKLHEALRAVTTVTRITEPVFAIPGSFIEETTTPDLDPLVPKQNPMNLLLPAYETMWRAVMRCVLEVVYRNDRERQQAVMSEGDGKPIETELEGILAQYLDALSNPEAMNDDVFWKQSATGITAADIVKEALRLYPPSRRIHRAFHGEFQRADIEKLHRSALLGQEDPLTFRPERWQHICPAARQ